MRVFSLGGVQTRHIPLAVRPEAMLAVGDRLYVIEQDRVAGTEDEETYRISGQRIVVLAPSGARLHVVEDPSSGMERQWTKMCHAAGKLLVCMCGPWRSEPVLAMVRGL